MNQAVILGESNCPDDVDFKNTSFFAQDLKADWELEPDQPFSFPCPPMVHDTCQDVNLEDLMRVSMACESVQKPKGSAI